MNDTNDLEAAVYLALGHIPELKPLIPKLTELVKQERRAAAEAMRERCAKQLEDMAARYPGDVFPFDSNSYDAIAGTALRLMLPKAATELRELPLDERNG